MKTNRYDRGSLTVEATIILPFFMCFFFLLLFLIKTACIHITLDRAVKETAKEIASCIYPISFLNELEDELAAEQNEEPLLIKNKPDRVTYEQVLKTSTDIITGLVSGRIKETDLVSVLEDAATQILSQSKPGARDYLFSNHSEIYYSFKDMGKYHTVKTLMDKHLAGSFVKPENLVFCLVEFPQSSKEYEVTKNNQDYVQTGLLPGRDFGKDDVVIQVEYELDIPLPLINGTEIRLTHTAVERAWLAGGNGVYTDQTEQSVFENEQQLVYITRTGIKYHNGDCRYLKKSRIPVYLEYARNTGYDPCKVCKPGK